MSTMSSSGCVMMMCFTPTRTASFTISFTSGGELWPVARIRSPLLSRVFVLAMICIASLTSGSSSPPSGHGFG